MCIRLQLSLEDGLIFELEHLEWIVRTSSSPPSINFVCPVLSNIFLLFKFNEFYFHIVIFFFQVCFITFYLIPIQIVCPLGKVIVDFFTGSSIRFLNNSSQNSSITIYLVQIKDP